MWDTEAMLLKAVLESHIGLIFSNSLSIQGVKHRLFNSEFRLWYVNHLLAFCTARGLDPILEACSLCSQLYNGWNRSATDCREWRSELCAHPFVCFYVKVMTNQSEGIPSGIKLINLKYLIQRYMSKDSPNLLPACVRNSHTAQLEASSFKQWPCVFSLVIFLCPTALTQTDCGFHLIAL